MTNIEEATGASYTGRNNLCFPFYINCISIVWATKMKSRIMYMELKTHPGGHNDRGPARIGRVTFNRTGKTLQYRGKRFQKGGTDSCANYHDVETNEGYWISGPKKNGEDRHSCGGGPVEIDEDVRQEYWTEIRKQPERAKEKFA